MLINLPNDIAVRLQDLAEERDCSVVDLVSTWIDAEATATKYGTLADLARSAERANLGRFKEGPTDTAARSREILNAEFAEYIRRKQ